MKEQISDLFAKITGESTGLGNLLNKVPGLDGYMERSRRREADALLRRTIADRLEDIRLQFSSVHEEISRDIIKAIDHAESLGRVDTRFYGLIGKIKDAPVGYAGFFDAVKVKEDDLARIYAFDETMLNHVDQIEAGTAALNKAARDDGDVGTTIRDLNRMLQDANETFASRDEVIQGVGDDGTADVGKDAVTDFGDEP
jgi:hypothetical protein